MNAVIFILAIVLPNGDVGIKYSILSECPDKSAVEELMNTKVKNKEILTWGGTCQPFEKKTAGL